MVEIKDVYKFLCFDLAKGDAGWCVLEYNIKTNVFNVNKVGNITSTKVASKVAMRDQVNLFGKDLVTFEVLENEVSKLIKMNNPDFVVAEDAYHKEHLSAYTSLILCLHVVGVTARKYQLPIYKIISTKHKSALTGNGHCKKETTIDKIKTHPNINFTNEEDKTNINEHQADSISVGYAFGIQILPGILKPV